jgi:hypothetical protein
MANGPAYLPSGEEFLYEEERDHDSVSLLLVSIDEPSRIEQLFLADIIVNFAHDKDLHLSQVFFSHFFAFLY